MRTKFLYIFLLLFSFSLNAQIDSSKVAWKIKQLTLSEQGGMHSIFPEGSKLLGLGRSGDSLIVKFDLPLDFLEKELDEMIHEELVETLASPLSDFGVLNLFMQTKDRNGDEVRLSSFFSDPLPPIDIPTFYSSIAGEAEKSFITLPNQAQPLGQLSGKTVWLSPGHGWYYKKRFNKFLTQRANHHGVVEDFSNLEAVNYYLMEYLYRSGANIWSVRERDMNTNEVIVDNDDKSPNYEEVGPWSTSVSKGYLNKTYRYSWTQSKETSAAIYTPDIPEEGWYWVSVKYLSSNNRGTDVRFKVQHAGGESVVTVNQRAHGMTWVYLGRFYFEKGRVGKVTLSNESSVERQAVIADAVRFGGGRASAKDCDFEAVGESPRYDMAARYYAKYQGYPECKNDVGIRPAYAEWELSKGALWEQLNAIYISWHTNAGGARGTESFIHSYRSNWKTRMLRSAIHDQLLGDLKSDWSPEWKDRGKKSADFGELRGLRTMPGCLIELGFHDNEKDAKALTTPEFRRISARAVYKGIVDYYAKKDNYKAAYLPEKPTHVHAYNNGDGNVSLAWNSPAFGGALGDAAERYKVYISNHGKAFAKWENADSTAFTFTSLKPETTYYFKVTSVNKGGESFDSPVVAVRTPKKGQGVEWLIVDGFDRLDRAGAVKVKETKPTTSPLGDLRRLFIEQMNAYHYMAEHAASFDHLGVAFDGASNEALIAEKLNLKDYKHIDWILGEESSVDKTLDNKEQQLLKGFLNNGGNLIISGSELAYHLDYKGAGRDFYRNYLKAKYRGDKSGTFEFKGHRWSKFKSVKGAFNREKPGAYLVDYPDYLATNGGSKAIVYYGNKRVAATGYKKKFGVVNFGFPLEMIHSDDDRNALFKAALEYLDAMPDDTVKVED